MKRIALAVIALLSVAANPPTDTLLPANTALFLSTPDAPKLFEAWDHTQFDRLLKDPSLKPFLDEMDRVGGGLPLIDRLGVKIEHLRAAGGGPAAVAVVPGVKTAATLAVLDMTGRADGRATLLKRADEFVRKSGGQIEQKMIAGLAGTVYTTPPKTGETRPTIFYQVIKDDVLILADDPAAIEAVLGRWSGSTGTLATHPPYQDILARAAFPDGKPVHAIWFIDPFGLNDALRGDQKAKKRDPAEMLRLEGFTAVKGIGGRIRLDDGPFDMFHRTAIHAPGPYQRAARMLNFPGDTSTVPPDWVPASISGYVALRWDVSMAFDSVGTLLDRVTGAEGDFNDVIKSIKEDKDGPMVDIKNEVVGRLTGRVTVITDCPDPVPTRGQRTLIGFEARDEKQLSEALTDLLTGDARRREFQGYVIWEVTPKPKKPKDGGKPIELPPTAIAVAKGQLFIADHAGLLEDILRRGTPTPRLKDDPQFLRAMADVTRLGGGNLSLRMFGRPAQSLRGPYELARTRKLDAADSASAKLLKQLTGQGENAVDVTKLPPYDKIPPHLLPFASYMVPVKDGWDLAGFAYKSDKP